ncbi:hypothetical protein O181_051309 [Austropuccinia psidii MF-1]|uniref:Uncharacterized protein n=1 Tax=Austropuccinia psidii MF-1 TaxID=1389203 RepID=A0A9Q3DYH3_9BASI|nr:hypothetical protein [Austropuccinia psidii MF-1]
MLIGLRFPRASISTTIQIKCSATEHFSYDPNADLSNGMTQAHAVFTCHTAAQAFVQTLSPSHTASMLAAVTGDQTCHVPSCMGHLWIAPTMHIQQFSHKSPPRKSGGYLMKKGDLTESEIQSIEILSQNSCVPLPHKGISLLICLASILHGTQWSEDLFPGKLPKFHLISTFDSSELTVPTFVEPSRADEPPIPGLSPSFKPHEDVPTPKPKPEVALTKSIEEPFGKSQIHFFYSSQLFLTFPSTISSLLHSTPLHHHHRRYACWIPPPLSPSPHVHPHSTPALRAPPPPPLIPTMMLARNLPTYD